MPVQVGELNTSVVDGERASMTDPAPAAGRPPWEELEVARRTAAELARLRARTCAEGFE